MWWFVILSLSSFHIPYYAGRTIPNFLALPLGQSRSKSEPEYEHEHHKSGRWYDRMLTSDHSSHWDITTDSIDWIIA